MCNVYWYRHPSVQNTILPNKVPWSVLFLLPGSSYLEPTVFVRRSTSVSSFKPSLKTALFKKKTFLHSHCPEMRLVCVCVCVCVCVYTYMCMHMCVCVCVCARTCVGLCVFMLHALNFDNIYFMCKHWGHVWVRCSKYSLLLLSLTSVV